MARAVSRRLRQRLPEQRAQVRTRVGVGQGDDAGSV